MKFSDFLKKHIVLFDGAFGTLLQKKAGNVGTLPERLNEERPELIATSTAPTSTQAQT